MVRYPCVTKYLEDIMKISVVFFAIVILAFLLPFILIECSGTEVAKISGFKMVFGGKVESPALESVAKGFGEAFNQSDLGALADMDAPEADEAETAEDEAEKPAKEDKGYKPNLWAIIALLMAVIGLITALIMDKAKYFIPLGAAVIGLLAMFFIKSGVLGSMDTSGGPDLSSFIKVKYQFGWYLALLGFILAGIMAFFAGNRKAGYGHEQFSGVIPNQVEDAFNRARFTVTETGAQVFEKVEDLVNPKEELDEEENEHKAPIAPEDDKQA